MKVVINPNGFNDARGAYMGLYIAIFRGEFDDQLCWPFNGSITVEAYNRTTEQWSNGLTITMNEKECPKRVERSVDTLAKGSWGCYKFLSLVDVNENYLKDTWSHVRFRVTSVGVILDFESRA